MHVDLPEALCTVHRAEANLQWMPEEWAIHDEAMILTALATGIDTPTGEIVKQFVGDGLAEPCPVCRRLLDAGDHGLIAPGARFPYQSGWILAPKRLYVIKSGAAHTLLPRSGRLITDTSSLDLEEGIAAARAQLDAVAFATGWAAGQATTIEEATMYALDGA